jgi:hypothetical protein
MAQRGLVRWLVGQDLNLGPTDYESKNPLVAAILCNLVHSNPLVCNGLRCISLQAIALPALPKCYTG